MKFEIDASRWLQASVPLPLMSGSVAPSQEISGRRQDDGSEPGGDSRKMRGGVAVRVPAGEERWFCLGYLSEGRDRGGCGRSQTQLPPRAVVAVGQSAPKLTDECGPLSSSCAAHAQPPHPPYGQWLIRQPAVLTSTSS